MIKVGDSVRFHDTQSTGTVVSIEGDKAKVHWINSRVAYTHVRFEHLVVLTSAPTPRVRTRVKK